MPGLHEYPADAVAVAAAGICAASAVIDLIAFSTLDGLQVLVNPTHVVSVYNARDENDPNKKLHGKVRCVVSFSNGKFITVVEVCDSVRKRLATEGKDRP